MYEHQGLQDILFVMLYGGAMMMALLAAFYLMLRKANAVDPDVESPRELRCWAAAFLTAVAASHVWWYVLGIHCLADDRLLRNIIAITLDRVTLVPLMMCVMLRMLQHRRYPLWPVAAAMVPFVAIAVGSFATGFHDFEWYVEVYSLLLCLVFIIYYVRELRKYGRWLRDNYADLEHKEVWQSLMLLACILLVYVVYTTNEGALATEYLAQLLTYVIVGFVFCRVETLQNLEEGDAKEEKKFQQEDAGDGDSGDELFDDETDTLMESLLNEHCYETGLYLQHDLTLGQLASKIGTNRTYLSAYFARKGDTYNKYIHRLRINHFCLLYRDAVANNKPFTALQLAQQSGYHSYSTFGSAFKQLTGQTATTWMKSVKSSN